MSTNDYRKCAKCGRTRIEDKSVSYHRFPNPGKNNITKALAWAKYCWPNEDWTHASLLSIHVTNKVLCGRHFALSQFYDNKRQKLSKFAVPESLGVQEFLNERENLFVQVCVALHFYFLLEQGSPYLNPRSMNAFEFTGHFVRYLFCIIGRQVLIIK